MSRLKFGTLFCLLGAFILLGWVKKNDKKAPDSQYDPGKMEFFLSAKTLEYVRPGLNLNVEGIGIPDDLRPEITISFTDDRGQPLDREGNVTPGALSVTFILAWYDGATRRYTNYSVQEVTSPITGNTATQADRDRGGTWTDLAVGRAIYKFNDPLPADYDPSKTHSLAIYASRNTQDLVGKNYIANLVHDFRPDGGPLEEVWAAVATETCNNCHDPLALHGGSRQEVKLCVTCHNPQTTDPDTGNLLDMTTMIHKIHRGEFLPSVEAGTPYQIIGFRQSVHDYSHVVYPMDIRNCTSCHASDAPEGDIWLTRPSRQACGSCHDDVNFATGEGHVAGPASDDSACANCHAPIGEEEFDASIAGAHTIPEKSSQLAGINLEVLGVTGAGPGASPTVNFTLTNNAGDAIAPSALQALSFQLVGPTTDYNFRLTESGVEGSVPTDNGYAYTFSGTLPEDAAGTFAIGMEAYRPATIAAGDGTIDLRETAENPVFYFSVDGSETMPRRSVVSDAKCESCHENLVLHGNIRHNTDYCVMCHTPVADDSPFRTEDQGPPRTIDFKQMIHRIHTGEDLSREYTLVGFRGSEHNYNEVLYPGDRRNCEACHVDDSQNVPIPSALVVHDANEFINPMPPNTAACIGCHDSLDASAHAFVNIAPFGEACGACHADNREFSVAWAHAR